MENQELILRSEALLCEESTLSPEKEQAYISEITKLKYLLDRDASYVCKSIV
ncbi:MAG: hypothetical protein J5999_00645 [Oscillospiraceae bacterium]|nr:hypothetical protein [Oscillospiraceae bacterium]